MAMYVYIDNLIVDLFDYNVFLSMMVLLTLPMVLVVVVVYSYKIKGIDYKNE